MEPNPILDKYADAFIYKRNVDQLIMDLLVDLLNSKREIQDKTKTTPWSPELIREYMTQYRLAHRTKEYDSIKTLLFSSFHKHQVNKMLRRIYRYLRKLPGYHHTALILAFATTIEGIKSMRFFSNDWRTKVLRDIEEALMIMDRNKNTILEPLQCAPKTKEELIQLLQELGSPYCLVQSPKSVFIKSSVAHLYRDKLAKRGIKITEMQIIE